MSNRLHLNVVDRLYLFYLAAVALLALPGDWPGVRLLLSHAAIALFIVLLAARDSRSPALAFLHEWYPLAMFIFSFEEVARFSLAIRANWQDWRILRLENFLLGGSPNLWWLRFHSRPVSELMDFGYFTYYPMFPLLSGLLYSQRDKSAFRSLVLSSVLMYLISFAAYIGFPCEGPRRALTGFVPPPPGYFFSWLVRLIQGGAGVLGNALPSSHMGLAVLCSWFACHLRPRLGLLFAASTALIGVSAAYDGYHYVSDEIAGVMVALTSLALNSLIVNLKCKISDR
jgi:PAP2 superfamily